MFSQFLSSTARQSTVAPEESSYCGIEVKKFSTIYHHILYLVDVNVLQWVPVQERRIGVWIEEEVEHSDVVRSHGLVHILVPDQELKDVELLRLVGSVESPEVFLHPLVDLEPGHHDVYILRPLQQKQEPNFHSFKKPGEVALQVGELGSQEEEEAHDPACDDSEDGLHQDPILERVHGTEVGALPVRVEHFARVGVELVDETTWGERKLDQVYCV